MSNKLPHERLRDWVEIAERKDVFASAIMDRDLVYGLGKDPKVIEAEAFRKLANEIEQCYVPWPRFGNGEPAKIGGVIESPTGIQARIDGVTVFDWGYRIEYGQDGKAWLDLPYGERLKRPARKAPDADNDKAARSDFDNIWKVLGDVDKWTERLRTSGSALSW